MIAHVPDYTPLGRRLVLAATLMTVLGATNVSAQVTTPQRQAEVVVLPYSSLPGCTVGGSGTGTAVLSAGDCAVPDLTSAGEASIDAAGALHARAYVASSGVLPPPTGSGTRFVQTAATATFYDILNASGVPIGSTVSFLGALTGTTSIGATAPVLSAAFPYYGMGWFDLAQNRYGEWSFAIPGNAGFPATRGNPLVFPVVNGSNYFSTFLNANAALLNDPATNGGRDVPLVGVADADYAHTGRIIDVRVYDAQGNDITGQVSLTFASGVTYGMSTVPEPGTWALLGTGLLALGGVARHRRRPT